MITDFNEFNENTKANLTGNRLDSSSKSGVYHSVFKVTQKWVDATKQRKPSATSQ